MLLKGSKYANLALTFFLELAVLVALGYWGFHRSILLGLGAPALAILVWAFFGAPTARWHLRGPWRVCLLILFYGSAVLALWAAGQPSWALVFAGLVLANQLLLLALGSELPKPALSKK